MTVLRKVALALVALAAAAVAGVTWRAHSLELPSPLRLEVDFGQGRPGRSEPLIVSGVSGAADFLFVRFIDSTTLVIGYDSWGDGGPVSRPVTLGAGQSHHLEVVMPGLDDLVGEPENHPRPLQVSLDGTNVLSGEVKAHSRRPDEIYLGSNPLGGTSCGPTFEGSLQRSDGQALPKKGGGASIGTLERWLAFALVIAAGGLSVVSWMSEERMLGGIPKPCARQGWARRHACFLGAAAVSSLVFSYFVTDGTFTFAYPETFGSFYDYQAASLLRGHLDVPPSALPDEAFYSNGKAYGYFGPFPALERIPFVLANVGFGRLSRSFMLADFIACLVASYAILRLVSRMLKPGAEGPSAFAILCLMINVGLGSTFLFVSSRAYTYHEAILSGAAWALISVYCTLRYWQTPASRWWLASFLCALACLHSRPSTGLFAFGFLACAALGLALRKGTAPAFRRRHVMMAVLCAAGIFSFNAVSYLKFKTFDGAPLRLSVQYNAARLARIDGKNFHFSNLPTNLYGYVWGPNFSLSSHFPYFLTSKMHRADFPGSKMDLIESVVGMPYSLTGLFFLATLGSLYALATCRPSRVPLALLWTAAAPFILAMFMAVATSQRYTADFCPLLITAAAFGLIAFEIKGVGRALRSALTLATLWSIAATIALTWRYQGEGVSGVQQSAERNYKEMGRRMDGFFERLFR